MRPHVQLLGVALLALVVTTPTVRGQTGLPPGKWTVIIHGRESGPSAFGPCGYPGTYDELTADSPGSDGSENWIRQIADHIEWLSNGSPPVNIYRMSAATLDLQVVNPGGTNPQDQSRHHILMFDWARTSGIVDASFIQELFFCEAYTGSDDGFAYAAGEALSATLRHVGADQKVFAMIGYSRGAVVASEVTKRLIIANHNPMQVVYLDGEGCNGGTCFIYTDGEFDAWIHSTSTPIRFDNIYSSFHERYPQPTHCPSGTDMGGHGRQACRNLSIDDQLYAHTPHLGGIIHCIASYGQGGVWDYLINHLNISNGLYTYNPNDQVQEPSVSPSVFSYAGLLFNGDFQWGSIAGWYGNGGGPSSESNGAVVLSNGAAYWLSLVEGFSMTHNYFAIPACASAFSFEASRAIGDGLQNELVVTLSSPGVTPEVFPSISVASLTDTLQPFGPYAVPERFLGRACRIRFEHTLSGELDTIVEIDNVALDAIGPPPTPSNPIIVDSSCGNATLAFSGSPPPGVTWFWQHQICATRVDLGSEPTFTVPTIGTYYLRARCDQTGAWSAGCGSVQVTSIGCGPAGDFDCNGTVEWADFQWFAGCLDGPDNAPPPNCVDTDIERDGDVDIRDFAVLQRNFAQSCETQAEMVQVAAGPFEMGGSVYDDERPYHWVQLGSYAIDRYEVTNAQYAAGLNWAYAQHNLITVSGGAVRKLGDPSIVYCDLTASSPYSRIVWSENTETFSAVAGRELHPVVMVSWFGAAAYCNWRSAREGRPLCYDLTDWSCNVSLPAYRLPTEAEWEKAAGWDPVEYRHYRYGERTDGCGTNCLDGHRANYSNSGDPFDFEPSLRTTPRGYYNGTNHNGYQTQDARSFYGCYDMSGNVVEWCNDWYSMSYYSTFPPLPPWVDPAGPTTGSHRVLRGGGYENAPNGCRSGVRSSSSQSDAVPTERSRVNGFRCVLGAQ